MEGGSDRNLLQVEICSMDRAPVQREAASVSLPGALGLFVVLPGHAPLLSTLDIGVMALVDPGGETAFYAVNGGVVNVLQNRVVILTETFEKDTEIDLERAESARERAEGRLQNAPRSFDEDRAEIALKRAIARIRARSHAGEKLTGGL